MPTSQLRSAPLSSLVEMGPCNAGTRPSSPDQKRHDGAPIDVAVRALVRSAIELGHVDAAVTHEEEVREDDAGPRAHPQKEADHPVVERLGERGLEDEIDR